ncbi:hypothetical protein T10_10808 [Trichinella papuae]|uniref:Uncharacterized protein n=1 Tax=Trichinella papuae TaxID=268474 RepID=A0A0V1M6B6_9BILA|nr:hypothetical protein T10_10808 [Trichinella papuae]
MDCTKATTTFRMNECCDKYHIPGRTLRRLAGGRRSVDTGRPTVDELVVLLDSGAAALWEDAEDAESRRGSWCRSAWCRSRRTPPTSNNSDTCIRGSRFRVWGKLSPAARQNKPRRLARVRRSRTIGRSRPDTGPSHRSRGGGTCSTSSRRIGPGRTGQADCRTDCWRWSVRRTVADGRTGNFVIQPLVWFEQLTQGVVLHRLPARRAAHEREQHPRTVRRRRTTQRGHAAGVVEHVPTAELHGRRRPERIRVTDDAQIFGILQW